MKGRGGHDEPPQRPQGNRQQQAERNRHPGPGVGRAACAPPASVYRTAGSRDHRVEHAAFDAGSSRGEARAATPFGRVLPVGVGEREEPPVYVLISAPLAFTRPAPSSWLWPSVRAIPLPRSAVCGGGSRRWPARGGLGRGRGDRAPVLRDGGAVRRHGVASSWKAGQPSGWPAKNFPDGRARQSPKVVAKRRIGNPPCRRRSIGEDLDRPTRLRCQRRTARVPRRRSTPRWPPFAPGCCRRVAWCPVPSQTILAVR